jgi:hypothetical protein
MLSNVIDPTSSNVPIHLERYLHGMQVDPYEYDKPRSKML